MKAALRVIFCLSGLVSLSALCWSQHTDSRVNEGAVGANRIDEIFIIGNERTRDFVILREMKTKRGDDLDEEQLELDRLRIESLGLFTRVEMQVHESQTGILLLIIVSERWYIFPIPIFYFNERNWDRISYGLGLAHMNFLGRNEQLNGSFWCGYNPGIEFGYSTPWLFGSRDLYGAASFLHKKVRNRSPSLPSFDEKHRGVSIALGRRIGYHLYLYLTTGYERVECEPLFTRSGDGIDDFASAGVSARYDTRDLREYPRRGWRIDVQLHNVGFIESAAAYLRCGFDVRRYQHLWGAFTLALRGALSYSSGIVPLYDKLYFGYTERIRGHFSEIIEGDHRCIGGAELRFPLIKERYVNVNPAARYIGGYSQNLKFGLSAGLFWDAGALWSGRYVTSECLRTGWGAGLHFHLPYLEVLRIEYALDGKLRGEFIVDAQVAF